jgi:hypothetical protein
MRFLNCVLGKNVAHAIKQVESMLEPGSTMVKHLQSKNDWRFKSGTSGEVISRLLEDREPISVFTYRPWNPFSKAIGYFDGKSIYLNVRIVDNFDFNLVCGLLLHEFSHYCGFTHGNNFKTNEKMLYSVPYYLSTNVEKF